MWAAMPASTTANLCCMDSPSSTSLTQLIPWPRKRGTRDSWCPPLAGPPPKAISSETPSTGQSIPAWTPPWRQNNFFVEDAWQDRKRSFHPGGELRGKVAADSFEGSQRLLFRRHGGALSELLSNHQS